jgi:hypothetical protein
MKSSGLIAMTLAGCFAVLSQPSDLSAAPADSASRARARHLRRVADDKAADGRRWRRGALAGPTSRPAGENQLNAPLDRNREAGGPLFHVIDRNKDGRLQADEIAPFAEVFNRAQQAARQADLTPQAWASYVEQLRPQRRGVRGGKPARQQRGSGQ